MGGELNWQGRRGSALLIVLGMVAFMIISAVAFSAYMRLSRLPSSYLRRAVSSRMLVKAALAQAIDEVDAAIGNNPHPGVGSQFTSYPRMTGRSANRNVWMGRVYIGTNSTELVAQNETVPSLSLEALAYLPPNLVNDVRYYSRHTTSARWHALPYDAGRFAFCAVDVSDYFDVNSLRADAARNSGPEGRVSLAHLFENQAHQAAVGEVDPADWDEAMEKAYKQGGRVPVVSMADFNLMLGDDSPYKISGWDSPFCKYLKSGNGSMFYTGTPSEEQVRRMAFVADSYFPESSAIVANQANGPWNLGDWNNQPFGPNPQASQKARELIYSGFSGQRKDDWKKCLDAVGMCALADYLDYDREPCTLALPTVERVPMICAVRPILPQLELEILNEYTAPTYGAEQVSQNSKTRTLSNLSIVYKLNAQRLPALAAARLGVMVTYPFRHSDNLTANFGLDGRMAFFFTVEGEDMGLRTGNFDDLLHYRERLGFNTARLGQNGTAVFSIPFTYLGTLDFTDTTPDGSKFSEITKTCDMTPLPSVMDALIADLGNVRIAEITFSCVQRSVKNEETGNWSAWEPSEETIRQNPLDPALAAFNPTVFANSQFVPLDAAGNKANAKFPETAGKGNLYAIMSDPSARVSCKLNAAVWARVFYRSGNDGFTGNDRTVDLVPASMADDCVLNGNGTYDPVSRAFDNDYFGVANPLLRFDTGVSLEFATVPAIVGGPAVVLDPEAAMVADPRYNHAPESWFRIGLSQFDPNTWKQLNHAADGDRDGDIYMSVSDQGYLQSIYELANLPRTTQFYRGTEYGLGVNAGSLYEKPSDNRFGLPPEKERCIRDNFEVTANHDIMWRTFDPFPREEGSFSNARYNWNRDGDAFDYEYWDRGGFFSSGNGFCVNPYTDNTNIIMAAFANTPHEWRLAGTNEESAVIRQNLPEDAVAFNEKYAWNQYCSRGARINWLDLEDLASEFMAETRQLATEGKSGSSTVVWKEAWDSLEWKRLATDVNQHQRLCGLDLTDTSEYGAIYNCDKKFLYGFWRECFAVKQQLFLVFVRAEPVALGGDTVYLNPPQLGAKAVALVWRDPNPTASSSDPHRTRVLFYRQFD